MPITKVSTTFTMADKISHQDYETLIWLRNDRNYREKSKKTLIGKTLIGFRKQLDDAIANLLSHAKSQGLISRIQNSENHKIPIVSAWNSFATAPDDDIYPCSVLAGKLSNRLLSRTDCRLPGDISENHTESNPVDLPVSNFDYTTFIENMNNGDMLRIMNPANAHQEKCGVNGETYYLGIRNWKARVKRFEPALGGWVDIESLGKPKLHTLEVTFTNDELFAFDPQNHRAFKGFLKHIVNHAAGLSGSHEYGQLDRSRKLWSSANVIELRGQPSANIYSAADVKTPDKIIVGRSNPIFENEQQEGLVTITRVHTERVLYIMDRPTLQYFMASYNGSGMPVDTTTTRHNATAKKIQKLITDKQISSFRIKPGSYNLYFATDHRTANDLFRKYQADTEPQIITDFIITKKTITQADDD